MLKKRLLIVDDSEIDREILRNILEDDFDVYDADNGYKALEMIIKKKPVVDAMLLDISMPLMDGFQVVRILRENGINDIPILMITAEATLSNVVKARDFHVTEFIRKPFDQNYVLKKLKSMFDMDEPEIKLPEDQVISENDLIDTRDYILKLTNIYKAYLYNSNLEYDHCVRVSELMTIMLEELAVSTKSTELDNAHIEIISAAAQFYNIGKMAVPESILMKTHGKSEFKNNAEKDIYQNHTVLGANIVWLNDNPGCRYFVKVCGDMCMHHHERYDGHGYPHKLKGNDNSLYTQMCIAAERFDRLYSRLSTFDESRFDVILTELLRDIGALDGDILKLMDACRIKIISYYKNYRR